MAKKGGAQQLQADIQSDEDFEKFIERPGLLVLDVYSEWCGPCLGMVGSLRKIKLELGGDNLQLAICKADGITALKRFYKKSEPTWLFITQKKTVNLMFGTNVPKLMKLIASELNLLSNKTRTFYAINEMLPEELQRKKVKEDAMAEAVRLENADKSKKRRDYLNYVTDTIMENLPDIGVTVFGPQVNRDMFKKIVEPADVLKIQCKDRKVVAVTREDFEVVNYACKNPLEEDVLEQLDQKELMVCFWKMPEDNRQPIQDVLNAYAYELTKTHVEPPDELNEEERIRPPIIAPFDIVVELELEEGEEYEEEEEAIPPVLAHAKSTHKSLTSVITEADRAIDDEEGEGDEGEEGEEDEGEDDGGMGGDMDFDFDLGLDLDLGFDLEGENTAEEVIEEPPKKRTRKKKIKVPPVWIAGNHRTHAALIYVFFPSQTAPFLPPDPVPEPPHVVMAFDAYKKRDLINLAERHKDDVPLYGFFTSDDADEAKYLANSLHSYAHSQQSATDKIVFKVNKQTSQTMLSMATYGPSYVSPSTVIGREEALKFFNTIFKTPEQERIEKAQKATAEEPKKKKSRKSVEAIPVPQEEAPSETPRDSAEEGAVTSGEDSGDSMPPEGVEGASPATEGEATAVEGEETAATEGEAAASATTEGEAAASTEGDMRDSIAEAAPETAPSADEEAPPAE